jgi:predicted RNase H-like HicB family nuclease
MEYVIVIEKTPTGYSAYAPDLPGCIATGRTLDEVRTRMREAIVFHIEGLKRVGLPIPPPASKAWLFELEPEHDIVAERSAETLYDIKTFARKAGIAPSTARVYAHRYHIGRKMGRGWVFSDEDLEALFHRHAKSC